MNKLLVIGYIWPEPNKTAAGYRILQLVDLFLEQEYEVVFCSAARMKPTALPSFKDRDIVMRSIELHDDSLDNLLIEYQPDIVLYDRFLIEEQYGWRVRQHLPNAIQILDTEDLHFLRTARENAVLHHIELEIGFESELAIREVSSMNRVDVNLIISIYEMKLLRDQFPVDLEGLFYIPFVIDIEDIQKREASAVSFDDRADYCTIGNLRHAPNVDSVKVLKHEIWPAMRKIQPEAKLFIYGPNAPKTILDLHDPESGFYIKGHVANVDQALSKHRILLAPLRYGAGLKGKVFDAMKNGLPVVGTSIAFEGISTQFQSVDHFASMAVKLYSDPISWNDQVKSSFDILKNDFDKSAFAKALFLKINSVRQNHPKTKSLENKIALHHADAHFKFMNYWIKAKKQ